MSQNNLPNELGSPLPLAETLDDKTVERGIPQNLKSSGKSNVKRAVLAFLVFIAVIFAIFSFLVFGSKDEGVIEVETQTETTINTRPKNFAEEQQKLLDSLPKPPPTNDSPSNFAIPTQQNVDPNNNNWANGNQAAAYQEVEIRRELTGGVLVDFEGGTGGASNTDGMGRASVGGVSRETEFSEQLKPSVMMPGYARKRSDLTYLLGRGSNIACTLQTKIVTTQSGITSCFVNRDVYSKNGKVLLVERGSQIIGEQTTALIHGQARVFILWNTIETPNGVSVVIDSPTADSLGASGQPAFVDRHFFERFGGAIMLSMVDDVAAALANSQRSKDSKMEFDYTRDSARNMAALALENTINIPPTGYVNQGTLLNVMVARDVDFSDIYQLVSVGR